MFVAISFLLASAKKSAAAGRHSAFYANSTSSAENQKR